MTGNQTTDPRPLSQGECWPEMGTLPMDHDPTLQVPEIIVSDERSTPTTNQPPVPDMQRLLKQRADWQREGWRDCFVVLAVIAFLTWAALACGAHPGLVEALK